METIIYLVRHVESLPNDVVTGRGQKQALSLVATLSQLDIDAIVSSPYQRAVATVQPFSEARQIPIEIDDGLKERKVSEGLIDNYLEVLRKSWADFDFKLPNCESARECQERVLRTLHGIVRRYAGKRIVASSHGNAIALVLNAFDRSFGFEDWKSLNNPDIKQIVYSPDGDDWNKAFTLAQIV
ncbi:MAG: histidine phosphatase family protein [bacterium]